MSVGHTTDNYKRVTHACHSRIACVCRSTTLTSQVTLSRIPCDPVIGHSAGRLCGRLAVDGATVRHGGDAERAGPGTGRGMRMDRTERLQTRT